MKTEKIFKITPKFIVKLENKNTVIYVDGKRFRYCSYLLLINPHKHRKQEYIDSIDEAREILCSELERKLTPKDLGITPEQEFWAHCSNLQAWAENNYDTRILHSNLAFPLLKELTKAGDYKAKRIFKDEIGKRILGKYTPVKIFLIEEDYLGILNREEIECILDDYRTYIENLNHNEIREKEIEIFVLISLKHLDIKYHNDLVKIYKKLTYSAKKVNISEIWYKFGLISGHFHNKNLEEYCFKNAHEINNENYNNLNVFGETEKCLEDWYALGLACKKSNQNELAIKCFNKTININRNYINAWGHLGTIYSDMGKHHEAIKAFKKALKLDSKNCELIILLSYEYHKAGKVNKLIKLCNEGLKVNSDIAELWDFLGSAYKDKSKINNAIKCYLKVLDLDPRNIVPLYDLIKLYYHKKEYNLACECCLRVLEIHPSASLALNTLSDIYLKKGEIKKVIEICLNALNTYYPQSSDWERLGIVYFNIKLYQKAIESFQKALQINQENHDIWHYLEIVYLALGDTNRAVEARFNKFYYYAKFRKKMDPVLLNIQ